jgi:hypothetical protein
MEKQKHYIYSYNHIYINCLYTITKIPYYYNSPYIYRNIENPEEFSLMIRNGLEKKPISYKHNFIGSHYNPNIPYGNITNTLYVPNMVNTIYSINNNIEIEYIDSVYEIKKNNLNFNIGIPISIHIHFLDTLVSRPKKTISIDFYIHSIHKSEYYISIRWKPIEKNCYTINSKDLVDIDLSGLIKNGIIDKYNNIEIYYSTH